MADNKKPGRTPKENVPKEGKSKEPKKPEEKEDKQNKKGESPSKTVSFPKEEGSKESMRPEHKEGQRTSMFQSFLPTKSVSAPKAAVSKEPQRPEDKEDQQPKTTKQFQNESPRRSPEDEHVKFFFELYPELKGSLDRTSNSPISSYLSGRSHRHRRMSQSEIYLQREMGLYSSINFLVIATIGTGIYLAPSVVLQNAGSLTEAFFIWILGGLFTFLIAVTYGELVFLVSQSGERFSYLLTAFTPINSFFGPLPAFLSIWIEVLFLGPAKVSLLSLVLADHLYVPLTSTLKSYVNTEISEPIIVKQVMAAIALGLITCINFRSMKTCVRVQHVFGVSKIVICVMVIGSGIYSLIKGNVSSFECLFKDMRGNSTGLLRALYVTMWSYDGWSNVVTITEEIKYPLWAIPRTVIIGLSLVIFIYLSMNVAFLSVLSVNDMKDPAYPYIYKYEEKLFGSEKVIMPVFFVISALSCAMCVQLGTSRSCFAAGREGHMLEMHTYLNVRRYVPTPALMTQALLSFILIVYIPLLDLIQYSIFVSWTFYGLAFVALIILRAKMPDSYRLYKTPLFIPIILTTISVLVTIDPIFRGIQPFLLAFLFLFIGVIVFHQTVYKGKQVFCMGKKFIHA